MKTVGGTELNPRVCNLNWNLSLPQENTPMTRVKEEFSSSRD